jgi:hypothetical protein
VKIEHDRTLYKQRNGIERMFGHLKINRASPPDTINWPTAYSAWSISPPPDTGSKLSTPPNADRHSSIWKYGSAFHWQSRQDLLNVDPA